MAVEDDIEVDDVLSVNTAGDSSLMPSNLAAGSRSLEEIQPSYSICNFCSQIERIIPQLCIMAM